MAVGARSRDILAMVMGQGVWQIATGLLLGAGLGVALGSAAALLLYRVSPYDPLILAAIALVLAIAALSACLVPARRAAAVDPMTALRYQ